MWAPSQEDLLPWSTKGAKQGSGLPIPRVITQGLGDVSSADRRYCSPPPSPRAELFSQDRDKFRTNDALDLIGFYFLCGRFFLIPFPLFVWAEQSNKGRLSWLHTHTHPSLPSTYTHNNLLTLTPMFLAKAGHFLFALVMVGLVGRSPPRMCGNKAKRWERCSTISWMPMHAHGRDKRK